MVNELILGALKSALARGESLKRAMMTLYNAGYKKEEISEAARSINEAGFAPQKVQQKQPQKPVTPQMLAPSKQFPSQPKQPQVFKKPQQPIQQQAPAKNIRKKVSAYEQPPKPEGKTMIILLGFLLLLLIGILVTIFLFKEELLNFFNNLFS